MSNYAPLHDRVLVQVDPEEAVSDEPKKVGSIFVPTVAAPSNESTLREATVLEVGTGEVLFDGRTRALLVKKGDRILVHPNEVLSVKSSYDPNEPLVGFISERNIIAKVSGRDISPDWEPATEAEKAAAIAPRLVSLD